jgi:eukaryotic-like serine/threonine-protein kinase
VDKKARHQKLRDLFDQAVTLDAPQQQAFLDALGARDSAFSAALATLLHADQEQAGLATQRPVALISETLAAIDDDYWLGRTIGKYRIISRLGMGGMGQVFLCERLDDAVLQRVALKIVRRDAMTPNLAKRFDDERQILASLQHPGIAHFIDAGFDETGLPYFVMEYVDGEVFSSYCERNQLGIAARIELFREIVAAIAYAHRNLVIHRDLKPSNVLISAEGHVKLLDFGIAKVVGDLSQTATSDRAFTFAYAAPEQLRGHNVGIACDVYGLGALLYEALTGGAPFDSTRGQGGLEQQILDTPPKSLAAAFAVRSKSSAWLSKQANQVKWRRELAGDLENIVHKALRKEPEARYLSADDFDADLQAYLQGRAVRATGGGLMYRAQKFIARHRFASLAALLFVISLTTAFIVIVQQNLIVRKERDRAESALQMLQDAFVAADPANVANGASTARQILERSGEQISTLAQSQPENFIALGNKLAEVNFALGLNQEASALASKVEASARQLGDQASAAQARRTAIQALTGASRFDEALALIARAESEGDVDNAQLLIAKGQIYAQSERAAAGVPLLLQGIARLNADPHDPQWVMAHWRLADAYRLNGEPEKGIALLDQQVAQLTQELGESQVLTLRSRLFRVDQLRRLKRNELALAQGAQLIVDIEKHYGNSSFSAMAHSNYANALIAERRYQDSISHLEQAIAGYEATLGAINDSTIRTRFNLAQVLVSIHPRSAQAEPHFRRAITDGEQLASNKPTLLPFFRYQFASYLAARGQALVALEVIAAKLTRAQFSTMSVEDRNEYASTVRGYFLGSECRSLLHLDALKVLNAQARAKAIDQKLTHTYFCETPIGAQKTSALRQCAEFRERYCESFGE